MFPTHHRHKRVLDEGSLLLSEGNIRGETIKKLDRSIPRLCVASSVSVVGITTLARVEVVTAWRPCCVGTDICHFHWQYGVVSLGTPTSLLVISDCEYCEGA